MFPTLKNVKQTRYFMLQTAKKANLDFAKNTTNQNDRIGK